jgi:signal peptidase I
MTETTQPQARADLNDKPEAKSDKKEGSFFWFLVKLVIVVLVFRTFVFTSFMIPSESMMPRLLVGDYLFAAKWPYGYTRAALPLDRPMFGDWRLFGRLPKRGDIVIFKHPIDRVDYVKRVIGLPGDQVQMIAGVLHLNGVPVPKRRIADFVVPIRADQSCRGVQFTKRRADGSFVCSYPQYRETLPNGVSYEVLDLGLLPQDTTLPVVVPEGRLFLMGDNRDNSEDSRFPARPGEGVGLVPVENLAGRASFMFFSTTSSWGEPSTWLSGIRWSRIGRGF